MGLGWQELIIIGMMLIMCLAALAPVILVLVLMKRRRQTSAREREIVTTPPSRQPDPYATRYGFDDADWQSDDEDNRRMASRTGSGGRP